MGGSTGKHVAVYIRVSSKRQDTASQQGDLQAWICSHGDRVQLYQDKQTGTSMDRPGWRKLETAIRLGKVSKIVVWRLDRLGRTASGLTALFEDLQRLGVGLVSLRDGIDLSTPAGRLMANVLASVAAYETEVRGERVRAGQAAAKARGKTWGGSKPGVRKKVTPEAEKIIRSLHANGKSVTAIADIFKLSRPTIYSVLGR